jgi:hypothetical protein
MLRRGHASLRTLPENTSAAPAAANHADPSSSSPGRAGLYYRDYRHGQIQGPFTHEALQAWRPYLPMDLMIWMLDEADFEHQEGEDEQETGEEEVREAGSPAGGAAAGPTGGEGTGSGAEVPPRKRSRPPKSSPRTVEQLLPQLPCVELAEMFGDGMLLRDWRQRRDAGQTPAGSDHAPPAPVYEHWLVYAAPRGAAEATGPQPAADVAPKRAPVMGEEVRGPRTACTIAWDAGHPSFLSPVGGSHCRGVTGSCAALLAGGRG